MKFRHPWALAGSQMIQATPADLAQTIVEDPSTAAYLVAYGRALGLEEAARLVDGATAERIRSLASKPVEPIVQTEPKETP